MVSKKFGKFLNQLNYYRVPHIPNFRSLNTIFKMVILAVILCAVFTLTQISEITVFGFAYISNISKFTPYFLLQCIFLFAAATCLKKFKPLYSILLIIFINGISVYIVDCLLVGSLTVYSANPQAALIKFTMVFTTTFLFLIYFDWKEKVINPANELARISFLQSKMNPHFLFNTLNTVVALIGKDDKVAKKMIFSLSDILRANLKENSFNFVVPIEEEIQLCDKYLSIEKIRMGDRLKIKWTIDNAEKVMVPKLSIQPLLENAIIHGISHLENGGEIDINIKTDSSWLTVSISNPYIEDETKKHIGNNITVKNLKERLALIYNGRYELSISKENNIFVISFSIPNQKKETYDI